MKTFPHHLTHKTTVALTLCAGLFLSPLAQAQSSGAEAVSQTQTGSNTSTAGAAAATDQGETLIRTLLGAGVGILNDASTPIPEKEAKFITLFRSNFHLKSIAGSTLRPGETRTETPEKLARFLQLFEAMVFRVYMKQIEQLSLNGFNVTSISDQADGAKIVKSTIERKDNPEPFKVDWVLYNKEGRFWVFDVTVDGVSLGQVQRQKIQDIRQGGDLATLLESMEKEYGSSIQK
jgi:ABC-type transporter MlaC component